jgi:hypothetical protein
MQGEIDAWIEPGLQEHYSETDRSSSNGTMA